MTISLTYAHPRTHLPVMSVPLCSESMRPFKTSRTFHILLNIIPQSRLGWADPGFAKEDDGERAAWACNGYLALVKGRAVCPCWLGVIGKAPCSWKPFCPFSHKRS